MTKQSGRPEPGHALTPSNDTSRIVADLRSISEKADAPGALTAGAVEAVMHARALRPAHLSPDLFSDPAWDMLLELLHAEISGRRVTLPILCKAASVQPSAGQRWFNVLVGKGLCTAMESGLDRQGVRLSEQGSKAMRSYFAALGRARLQDRP